jgi:site-specific DNA-cytosine methylase
LAFNDPRSKLFFEFVRLKQELKPDYFLLENVKMKREYEIVISKYMGVAPIEINAALVSAQSRRRNFWTNIKNEPYGLFGDMQCTIPQPKDRGILLKDILENNVPKKYYLSDKAISRINEYNNSERMLDNSNKSNCLAAGYSKLGRDNTYIIQLNPSKESGGKQPYQQNRVYDPNGKNPALCSGQEQWGGNAVLQDNYKIRRLTPLEAARLQSIPEWYKWNCSDSQTYKMLGNGFNIEVIKHILNYIK